jgi:hypothetical protein
LPIILARLPDRSAKSSPHDLQLMLVVVCENITAFSPHFSHCTERNALLGFGIMMLCRFMSYLQLADPQTLLHRLVLTSFTGIS